MRAPLAGSVQWAAWESLEAEASGANVQPRGTWKPYGPSTRAIPGVVVFGDGLAARVGDGVAGPDAAAEGEAVVAAAVGDAGDDEVAGGDGEPTPARFPGAGACRWRARSTAAPATRRAQATMTASFSRLDGKGMAGCETIPPAPVCRGAAGEPVSFPHERLRWTQRQGSRPRPGRAAQPGS